MEEEVFNFRAKSIIDVKEYLHLQAVIFAGLPNDFDALEEPQGHKIDLAKKLADKLLSINNVGINYHQPMPVGCMDCRFKDHYYLGDPIVPCTDCFKNCQ